MRTLIALLALTASAHAELVPKPIEDNAAAAQALRAYYTKHEFRVPMRDGVRLHTVAYVPKPDGPWPILMIRTPYASGPYGVDAYPTPAQERELHRVAPSWEALRAGYIFVNQDVRGRFMSEGSFVDVRPYVADKKKKTDIDEASDTWDTIDFLVKHLPRNNGNVGLWGVSYPGFYAAMGAVDAHPALKAVSPQAPVTDWFVGDDFHHNGAFALADAALFYRVFGVPRPRPTKRWPVEAEVDTTDGYDFFLRVGPLANVIGALEMKDVGFWQDLMTHGVLDDFWRARNPRPFYKKIRPAVMVVGGWYDAEDLYGSLETYRAIERQSPGAENVLVMGPWSHGGWHRSDGDSLGDQDFGAKTSIWYRGEVELPFFERHLRGKGTPPKLAEATVFETGSNEWRRHDAWPPRGAKPATLWLAPLGKLASQAPTSPSVERYVSDPAHPVPYAEVHTLDRGNEFMTADQRFASRRPDVLSYVSSVVEEDLALAGPIEADLWVSTTGSDADFIVKLIDLYPPSAPQSTVKPREAPMAGYERLVRGEIMRGKFRDGLDRPKPFQPGQVTRVRFTLPDVSHAFRAGHRIAVQIQSSWFPLFDRNPQRFVDIYHASESDFQVETMRVHAGGPQASKLTFSVLRGSLPR